MQMIGNANERLRDPKVTQTIILGWSGGQNMCDVHSTKRLVALRFDGLLEKGVHDVMP